MKQFLIIAALLTLAGCASDDIGKLVTSAVQLGGEYNGHDEYQYRPPPGHYYRRHRWERRRYWQ